jgi:hypothetical protein
MSDEFIAPSIDSRYFTCPSCGVASQQAWFNLYADPINNEEGVPLRLDEAGLQRLRNNPMFTEEVRRTKVEYWERVTGGEVFLDRWAPCQSDIFLTNTAVSACHACRKPAIWLQEKIIFPPPTDAG